MAKVRYHFNTKSLSYEKVKTTLKEKSLKILSLLASGIVFSTLTLVVLYNVVDSPKERILERELALYKSKYKILNERLNKLSVVLDDIENRDNNIYRLIFEAEPIPESVRKASYGGVNRYAELEDYDNSQLVLESMKNIDRISRQLYIQSKSFDEVYNMAKQKEQRFASIPAIIPIKNGAKQICSGFGYRIHPIYKTLQIHSGVDIMAPRGTRIYATGDGVVAYPNRNLSGYGIVCVINHGFGYETLYGHMSRMAVHYGQKVKRGQLIGYVGSTGISTAPHLHYEVWKGTKKVNPVHYFYNDLTPAEYEKVIEESSKITQSLS
ncbi:MAG: M23 family metallopeptidase [Bacteroidales bacterium]|nr:M23 family metallopeptidase [Bacteroidales bacterium]